MLTPAERLAKKKKPKRFKTARGIPAKLNCRILELRQTMGLTVRDVASGCEISESLVCRAEHGMELWVGTAMKIAQFFGLPVEEIWSRRP